MQFEDFYKKYFQVVFTFLLNLSGDRQIAEEITSETFFKALKSIDSFRGECEFSSWLFQIAKNTYYSYMKKHKRTVSENDIDIPELTDTSSDIESLVCDADEANRIKKHLKIVKKKLSKKGSLRLLLLLC